MRLLADVHIAPRTVQFLRSRNFDAVRVTDFLPPTASDEAIIDLAIAQEFRRKSEGVGERRFGGPAWGK